MRISSTVVALATAMAVLSVSMPAHASTDDEKTSAERGQPSWDDLSGEQSAEPPTPSPSPTPTTTAQPAPVAPPPGGLPGPEAPWASYVGQTVTAYMDTGESLSGIVKADQGAMVQLEVPGAGLRVVAKQRVTSVVPGGAAPSPTTSPASPAPVTGGEAAIAPAPVGTAGDPMAGMNEDQKVTYLMTKGKYAKKAKSGKMFAIVGITFMVLGLIPLVAGVALNDDEDAPSTALLAGGGAVVGLGVLFGVGGAISVSNTRNKARADVRSGQVRFEIRRAGAWANRSGAGFGVAAAF